MKCKVFFVLSLFAFTVLPATHTAHAQQWSDEEQELLDFLESSWNVWMEAIKKDDPEIWIKAANAPENLSYWVGVEGAPVGLRTLRRDWDAIREQDINWIDFRPVSVRIHDNVGIIHFYGYWKAKTDDGPVTTEHKRTEIFLKKGGKWSFIGGHNTPVSQADAEPYK